uniref:Methyltransferase domain-containing protein n=1 Tax=Geoglobus ahangari TaxID=113653 RepID=A0A7C4S850_9EURY
MRIDKWLVLQGYFDSRSKAKEAVKRGLVRVNGNIVKPSYEVKGDEKIEILESGKPKGYFKLKELDMEWGIIKEGDVVLDLGSSAGGFLLYASEKAKRVIGIEVSREFEEELKKIEKSRNNVEVIIDDAFKIDTSKLPNFDLILCDLTLEPEDSFKALQRFLDKLKDDGRILFVSKDREFQFPENFNVIKSKKAEDKREWFYLVRVKLRRNS